MFPEKIVGYTVGVLVETNFSGIFQLNGVPVAKELYNSPRSYTYDIDGSCMIVVIANAPLSSRYLERLGKRAMLGLATIWHIFTFNPANTLRTEFNIKNWFQNGYTTLSLNSNLKQSKVGQFETETPAYNLMNFGFGGDVTFKTLKYNTSLSINNVLKNKHINHLSRLKADNILNAGRNIVFGLSFKI